MYCINCGNKLKEDANFCTNCGERVQVISNNPIPKEVEQVIEIEEKPPVSKVSDDIILGIIFGTMVLSIMIILIAG